MAEYHSLTALQKAIQNEVQNTVKTIEQEILDTANKHIQEFYLSNPKPKYYQRTGLLKESPKSSIEKNGNQYQINIYLDTNYAYPTGTWSAQQVINEAEQGNLIGKGGFWENTLKEIPNIIEEHMKRGK